MATVTKVTRRRGGRAYEYHAVRFTDPGSGQEKTRYFSTKKEADKVRTEIEGRIEAGSYSGVSHKMTVRELANKFRAADYFPKGDDALRSTTVSDYETAIEKHILPRWGAVRLIDIRASMLDTWRKEQLAAGVGKSPMRKALMVLGRMYRFAMRDHIVASNPTMDVSKPAVRARNGPDERLTAEQLVELFKVTRGRTRIIVRIGALTGLREGEIFGLRWRDVDLDKRVIQVRGQYTHGEFVEHAKNRRGIPDDPDGR